MKNRDQESSFNTNSSRRNFIKKVGVASAGMLVAPYLRPSGIFGYDHKEVSSFLATVAITDSTNTPADIYTYDDANGGIKQKVNYILGLLDQNQSGRVSALFSKGKKVAIKINLTGGSSNAASFKPSTNARFPDVTITEAIWTHPAVLQAVGQFIIDAGVNPTDLYIVESFWDTTWQTPGSTAPFGSNDAFGYSDVQRSMGCNVVDLNDTTPANLTVISTGSNYFNFSSFTMNKILQEVDVYVSIPKLKDHSTAGITCSLKNQIGAVPKSLYTIPGDDGDRGALHHAKSTDPTWDYLPLSICDLAAARPVNLAVVDGVKSCVGGEGPWCTNFDPASKHVLIAGLEPVAADSIAANIMGLNSEGIFLPLPGPLTVGTNTSSICDNYLYLLNQKGDVTNQLSQIQLVGDGASMVTSVRQSPTPAQPSEFMLSSNFPNPFNPSTKIVFYLPRSEFITLTIFDITGREIETLIKGEVPAGEHRLQWSAEGLASGVYLCRMVAKGYSESIKMVYQK
ncbi:MAG: DUF362 domain-containing protein [Candidatus Kryptoniota bacterium]